MKCPKCNTEMKDYYCMKCGYLLHDGKEHQLKRDFVDKNILADFLGTKYNYFLERKFNLSAAFLGPIYLGYRKLFKEGIFYAVLDIVIGFSTFYFFNHCPLFSNSLDSISLLQINLIQNGFLLNILLLRFFLYGCLFNPFYLKKVKNDIGKLDAIEISRKSKTSVRQAIMVFLLQPTILLLIFICYQWLK